jgi:hypothetical protein
LPLSGGIIELNLGVIKELLESPHRTRAHVEKLPLLREVVPLVSQDRLGTPLHADYGTNKMIRILNVCDQDSRSYRSSTVKAPKLATIQQSKPLATNKPFLP